MAAVHVLEEEQYPPAVVVVEASVPKLTNEVQHLVKVLSWESVMDMSPLKSGVRLPAYKPRDARSADRCSFGSSPSTVARELKEWVTDRCIQAGICRRRLVPAGGEAHVWSGTILSVHGSLTPRTGLVARAGCRSVQVGGWSRGSSPTRASTGSYTVSLRGTMGGDTTCLVPSRSGARGRRGGSRLLHGYATPDWSAPRAPLTAALPATGRRT